MGKTKDIKYMQDKELVEILVKAFVRLSDRHKVFILVALLIVSNTIWLVLSGR